jgi:hypothetical protein
VLIGDTVSPYYRNSIATVVGTKSTDPLSGSNPTLLQEYAATMPQFAIIMFGSNDIQGRLASNGIEEYETGLRGIADTLIRRGVIPVFSTMPERLDQDYDNYVPAYNAVVRAVCQGLQIPFYDLNRELWPLPYHGINMPGDPVHILTGGFNESCFFCAANGDLNIGVKVRNLVTMQELLRVKKFYVDGLTPPDQSSPRLSGDGSPSAPFVADRLPFVDMRDNRTSANTLLTSYAGTGAPLAAAGPEYLYRLVLSQQTAMRIVVLDAGKEAVSVHLLAGVTANTCLESAPRAIQKTLNAGTYFVAVDGNTAGGGAEYTLSMSGCVAGDTTCAH